MGFRKILSARTRGFNLRVQLFKLLPDLAGKIHVIDGESVRDSCFGSSRTNGQIADLPIDLLDLNGRISNSGLADEQRGARTLGQLELDLSIL